MLGGAGVDTEVYHIVFCIFFCVCIVYNKKYSALPSPPKNEQYSASGNMALMS